MKRYPNKPLVANGKTLDLSRPQIMGILNVTPDSFSDGGKFLQQDQALSQVEQMLQAGASIIDIGGESTRPNAQEVSLDQELQRVVPLVEAVRQRFDCWISVDTSKPQVMYESAQVGMDLINDIRALQEPLALETALQLNLPVCIMHMQGQPRTMQENPHYENVVEEVFDFLQKRSEICIQAGMAKEQIIWDVGFGFGKTLEHNYQLLRHLTQFCESGHPVLAGLSRKSMIGNLLDKPVEERVLGSVIGATIATMSGAAIVRVHDVAETAEAFKILKATYY